jgi:uncharacterized protein YciI
MAKQYFFFKLIPPRPTFAMDMDERERGLMMQHIQYFQKHFSEKQVLIYGPVMAAKGSFGMAVLHVEDEAEARGIAENDPTILAGLHTFEIYPMMVGAAQGAQT